MKYYIYISDSKVDMLLAQIPHEQKKKIATEFKVDLKLLSASRRAEAEDESNRFTRVEAVATFIREYGNVGSVDAPDEYVEGDMLMRWGPYLNTSAFSRDDSPLVYFGASTDRTIIGLGGSAKHVIGNTGPSSTHSHSITPMLIGYLKANLEPGGGEDLPGRMDTEPLWAVSLATEQMKGPEQRLEFLAKRLLYGRPPGSNSGQKILLATPLYVAMAD